MADTPSTPSTANIGTKKRRLESNPHDEDQIKADNRTNNNNQSRVRRRRVSHRHTVDVPQQRQLPALQPRPCSIAVSTSHTSLSLTSLSEVSSPVLFCSIQPKPLVGNQMPVQTSEKNTDTSVDSAQSGSSLLVGITKSASKRQRTQSTRLGNLNDVSSTAHIDTQDFPDTYNTTNGANMINSSSREQVVPTPLLDAYARRKEATLDFPPKVTAGVIKRSIIDYQNFIVSQQQDVQRACASCGGFIQGYANLIPSTDTRLELFRVPDKSIRLDCCGLTENGEYQLCSSCYRYTQLQKPPKFSALNNVNVTLCQELPYVLTQLSITEECLIARCHPVGSIVKLRPNGRYNDAAYNRVRGHVVVLPQEPGPLLSLLPSPDLQLHEKIKVVWFGSQKPKKSDLLPYLEVRKTVVLHALTWLCAHNELYSHVTINRNLLDLWPDSHIPRVLESSIVHSKNDEDERQGYNGDLGEENYENEFQESLGDNRSDPIMSGCVYSDAECIRQVPELRFISALMVMKKANQDINGVTKDTTSTENHTDIVPEFRGDVPVIRYISHNSTKLMSSWQDHEFFTGAFPTLFPYGLGGHLPRDKERKVKVSLEAWCRWALMHHSRRFARHPTFLYLAYDTLQLRSALTGQSLMIARKDWKRISHNMDRLTFNRLTEAAKSLKETGHLRDPVISDLVKQIDCVAHHVPQSYARTLAMRIHIRGLFISDGMPALWLTLNPTDLNNPIVLSLAGLDLSTKENAQMTATTAKATALIATVNPVAVAQFFHTVMKGIFFHLVGVGNKKKIGILGEISNHFGVVETNGRGMLHCHALLWMHGNLDFPNLRDRLLSDAEFSSRVTEYLSSIISCSIDEGVQSLQEQPDGVVTQFVAMDSQDDREFLQKLHKDANSVALKRQMHSTRHNATCFKYKKAKESRHCRFLYPRALVRSTYVDEHGVIQIKRNNCWIAPYNPSIATQLRSNHDISFIPTVSKALAAVYYMTNYATKHDVSQYQQVLAAAMVQKHIDDAQRAQDPTQRDLRLRNMPKEKFGMAAFNRLATEIEVSGPQAAACLLGYPDCYTRPTFLRRLNLNYLRNHLRRLISGSNLFEYNQEDKTCIKLSKKTPTSLFENYWWRGPRLCSFSLYEYCKLVDIKSVSEKRCTDILFDSEHPRYEDQVQRFDARREAHAVTLGFTGSLTKQQPQEDQVRGGHIETQAIQDDLAAIYLILLVPWQDLPDLFVQYRINSEEDDNTHYAEVWNRVRSTVPQHLQDVAMNFRLLKKSQDEARVDAAIRREAELAAWQEERDLNGTEDSDDNGQQTLVEDSDEEPFRAYDPFDLELLRQAVSVIQTKWLQRDHLDSKGILALQKRPSSIAYSLTTHPYKITRMVNQCNTNCDNNRSGGVYSCDTSTLHSWEELIQGSVDDEKTMTSDDYGSDEETYDNTRDQGMPETNLTGQENSLFPIISRIDRNLVPDLQEKMERVGQNPTGKSLTSIVEECIPLNIKQQMVVQRVLDHAIKFAGQRSVESENQMLLYVAGEGGVGKSRVIKAIQIGYELLGRGNEVMLTAPTGAAADAIDGHTIHSCMALNRGTKGNGKVSGRCRYLWKNISILIIDEISMVSLSMLNSINNQCNLINSVGRDSTACFGALPIVITLGDFHQFAPVGGQPLWHEPKDNDNVGKLAKYLWSRFHNVVILDEQMRQREDKCYLEIIRRARSGCLNNNDVNVLNSRVVKSLNDSTGSTTAVAITRLNSRRHSINRTQIERFARDKAQDIYIFPASHTRAEIAATGAIPLDILLDSQDGEHESKGPGLFLYTHDMPVMVLQNICTRWGLVNGAKGFATGVVAHQQAQFVRINDLYILCSHPPACVLFKRGVVKHQPFPFLQQEIIPVFAKSQPVEIFYSKRRLKKIIVRRTQVPMTAAFALTEYKVQGATYSEAILDLARNKKKPSSLAQDSHRSYCSTYVQLSRIESLNGLHLLQRIKLSDIQNKPHPLLCTEDARIELLATDTLKIWLSIEKKDKGPGRTNITCQNEMN